MLLQGAEGLQAGLRRCTGPPGRVSRLPAPTGSPRKCPSRGSRPTWPCSPDTGSPAPSDQRDVLEHLDVTHLPRPLPTPSTLHFFMCLQPSSCAAHTSGAKDATCPFLHHPRGPQALAADWLDQTPVSWIRHREPTCSVTGQGHAAGGRAGAPALTQRPQVLRNLRRRRTAFQSGPPRTSVGVNTDTATRGRGHGCRRTPTPSPFVRLKLHLNEATCFADRFHSSASPLRLPTTKCT